VGTRTVGLYIGYVRYQVRVSHRFVCSLGTEHTKDLAADLVKPYKINDTTVNQAFELKHGKSIRVFNMDKVSNGLFVDVSRHVNCTTSLLDIVYRKSLNASRARSCLKR
jgi:hypothetical protein